MYCNNVKKEKFNILTSKIKSGLEGTIWQFASLNMKLDITKNKESKMCYHFLKF